MNCDCAKRTSVVLGDWVTILSGSILVVHIFFYSSLEHVVIVECVSS